MGHLVSQCIFKYDKLTCFKCGKKGHKIYDCQIFITTANTYCHYAVEREPQTVENQKRGWMKEELKRAKCVQCGSFGHLYCTNDHLLTCKLDEIYNSGGKGLNIGRDFFNCSTYNHYEQFKNGGVDNQNYRVDRRETITNPQQYHPNDNNNYQNYPQNAFLALKANNHPQMRKAPPTRRVSQFERSLEKFKNFDRMKREEQEEKKKRIRIDDDDEEEEERGMEEERQ